MLQPSSALDDASPFSFHQQMLANRQVLIGQPITALRAEPIMARLLWLNKQNPREPISLYINCPGGEIASSLAIIETMKHLTAPVYTYAMGQAHGAALLILAHGTKGHRHAQITSQLSLLPATAKSDARSADRLHLINEAISRVLRSRTRLSRQDLARALAGNGRFFSHFQALDAGIIDSTYDHWAQFASI